MSKKLQLFGGGVAAFGLLASTGYAQDTTQPNPNPPAQEQVQDQSADPTEEQVDQSEAQQESATLQPNQTGEQAEKQADKGRLYKVEDLVDAKVRNAADEELGDIEEMVVDVTDGSIRYAVISHGGFLNIGEDLFAVPLKAMKVEQNEDGEAFFIVDIQKQQLEQMKGFNDDNWPNFADQSFTSGVDKQFNVKGDQQASGRKGALYKLSTFEGVNVRDRQNQELGEVEEILVDAKQAKVAYLALDLEDEAEAEADDDAYALVPMQQIALKTQGDDTFLQTQVQLDQIRNAPKFTEEQLANVESHEELRRKIDAHFGTGLQEQRVLKPQTDQPQTDADQNAPQSEPQTEEEDVDLSVEVDADAENPSNPE